MPALATPYLTKKGEYALVFFQDLGNSQVTSFDPTQWIKQEVTIECPLSLLCPYINLLLVVREGAVIPVFTVLLVKHIYKAINIRPPYIEWRLESELRSLATPYTVSFSPSPSFTK